MDCSTKTSIGRQEHKIAMRRLLVPLTPLFSSTYIIPVSSRAKSRINGRTNTKDGTLLGSMPKNNMSNAREHPPAI
jgi:hypothetical protein